jgi:O-antigen/teichoic acid export membrane protein
MTSKHAAFTDFVRGGAANFIAISIGYVLLFFYKIIVARTFSPAEYGLLEMALTIVGVLAIIGGAGFYQSFSKFIPLYQKRKSLQQGFQHYVFAVQCIVAIALGIILYISAPLLTSFFSFSPVFTLLLKIVAFAIPLKVFSRSMGFLFASFKRNFIAQSGIQIMESAVLLIGSIAIAVLHISLPGLALLVVLAYAAAAIFYIFHYKKIRVLAPPKYEIKTWLNYSIPLLFAGVLAFILNWTDNFVIGRYLTEAHVGWYGLAFSFAFYLFFITSIFSPLILPVLTSLYQKNKILFNEILARVRFWAGTCSFVIALFLIMFSRTLIGVIFGEEFLPAALPLAILASFFTCATYLYFSQYVLYLENKTQYIAYTQVVVVVLNIIFSIILVQSYGIVGVAFSSGASFLLLRLLLHVQSARMHVFTHHRLLLFKVFVAASVAALLSFIGLWLTSLEQTTLGLFLAFLLYVFVFLFALRYGKILSREDIVILEVIEQHTNVQFTKVKLWLEKNVLSQ